MPEKERAKKKSGLALGKAVAFEFIIIY